MAGMKVGKYEIMKNLGEGGFGEVMLGWDPDLKRKVAVKKLRASVNSAKEADFMKKFSHSGLPQIYELLRNGEEYYLVMEYLEGITLKEYIKRYGPVNEERCVSTIRSVAQIIKYLHDSNPMIIYRDLKPENIMICTDGNIRLLDFGAALERTHSKDECRENYGTPGYSAPELWQGKGAEPSADIYSLGVVMHEMLTMLSPSKAPYTRLPIRSYDRAYSKKCEKLIERCLKKEPSERYQTVDEFLEALSSASKEAIPEKVFFLIKKLTVFTAYLDFVLYTINTIYPNGLHNIDYSELPKSAALLGSAVLLHVILIYRGMNKYKKVTREKRIYLTEKKSIGLYAVASLLIGLLLGMWSNRNFEVYADETPMRMWVDVKDKSERNVLVKFKNSYSVDDRLRLEIPKEAMPKDRLSLYVMAVDGDGHRYKSREFLIENSNG